MNNERTDLFEPATHLLTSLMLEGRKKKLAARGPWNLNIIRKIDRKIRLLQTP